MCIHLDRYLSNTNCYLCIVNNDFNLEVRVPTTLMYLVRYYFSSVGILCCGGSA